MGRRPLLLIGAVIMIFSLTFVGVYIKINGTTAPADGGISQAGIAACAFIYIFVIGYVSSFAGIPYMLSSECVPLNVRATSATLGAAMQWLMNLVISKITPYLIASIGYGTFFFFAAWLVLGFLYVWFFVPETKGVSLEHMAKVFGQKDEVEQLVREDEEKRVEAQLKAEQLERV
jgi:MFS family permease